MGYCPGANLANYSPLPEWPRRLILRNEIRPSKRSSSNNRSTTHSKGVMNYVENEVSLGRSPATADSRSWLGGLRWGQSPTEAQQGHGKPPPSMHLLRSC